MSASLSQAALPFALGLLLGGLLLWLIQRGQRREPILEAELASERKQAAQNQAENAQQRQQLQTLHGQLARLEEANRHLQEETAQKREELGQLLEHNRGEFAHLARKILDEQSKRFTEASHERLGELLVPFRDRMVEFREKVEKTHESQGERFAALRQELSHLRQLNQQISQDALNLTHALRGESQVQGAWGEMLLERILEQSGLQEGSEYTTQGSYTTESEAGARRVRPDVVIHLPDQRHVIIDSKVSLVAYADYVNAEDPAETESAAQRHRDSLRAHLKGISLKNYQQAHGLESLDFILVFIPIESAFNLALQRDTELYDSAFRQNIVLVTPSTLLASLRVIENLWRQDKQNRNALRIADEAGKLYDKLVGFLDDMDALDNRLRQAKDSYHQARKKLQTGTGNLIGRAEKLRKLGARTTKTLPSSSPPEEEPTAQTELDAPPT
ncbi:MAG: DNA recombination protein RmuC [Verrucomicrobiota bacterium]